MKFHPWHHVSYGKRAPEFVSGIIEIPKNSRAKYELDKESGMLMLDRVLYSSINYPANYGFIPQTLAEDDDPLDILVLCQFAVHPLTLIESRPIGMLTMVDAGKNDHKIIAVAVEDPEYNSYETIDTLPNHRLEMITRFFRDYKRLEQIEVDVRDLQPIETAHSIINEAMERFGN